MNQNKIIFVAGAGLMGSGIAQTAISSGFPVILYDVSLEILDKAKAGIAAMLNKNVQKGRMTEQEAKNALSLLRISDSVEDSAEAKFVIEAIIEKEAAKKDLFSRLTKHVKDTALLATNTSSISVAEIASVVDRPERFVGMHFFSPVPLMELLEVVRAIGTSQETVDAACKLGEEIGKTCIVAKDRPAFIVNRMLDPMINEAIGILQEGVGSVEDIDLGMRKGLNHPMGPLELIDMAGIDIELAVMEVLYRETGDPKYRPAPLLRDMVRMGWLGRKSGMGFYIYDENRRKYPNPAFEK